MIDFDILQDKSDLDNLSALLTELQDAQETVEGIEIALKMAKESLRVVSQEKIPKLLNDAGLSEIKLSDGKKVVIKDQLKASIPKGRIRDVFYAMVSAEVQDGQQPELAAAIIKDMFKESLTVPSGDSAEQFLLDAGIPFDKSQSIHWQTLAKYCKDRLAQGKEIPAGINHFEYQETVLK